MDYFRFRGFFQFLSQRKLSRILNYRNWIQCDLSAAWPGNINARSSLKNRLHFSVSVHFFSRTHNSVTVASSVIVRQTKSMVFKILFFYRRNISWEFNWVRSFTLKISLYIVFQIIYQFQTWNKAKWYL